jgi:hypothetical protein
MKRELNVVPRLKSLFEVTIDESQLRLEGEKHSIIVDETSAHTSSATRSCVT